MPDVPASHRDLLDSQVATLATIDDDGFPQLTEVWFLHEDGEVKVSVNTSRWKLHNLQRRPQCSLLVLDPQNPYRYLELRGRARVEPDADRSFAARLGRKYGADLTAYDAPDDGRVVITIEPEKIHPVDEG
ncbi:MAG TPA: PPOX class F420-dependent oxidoreductase [Gaiellaceae bacterium]|nr:PPOX class F420-dependent oxidoreductase [Gaiellaceae bacterium]